MRKLLLALMLISSPAIAGGYDDMTPELRAAHLAIDRWLASSAALAVIQAQMGSVPQSPAPAPYVYQPSNTYIFQPYQPPTVNTVCNREGQNVYCTTR